MRISQIEKDCFVRAVQKYDPAADIYLFGSRADDSLKGGDIDLLVVSDILGFSEKISILVEIKSALGDQKIDLLIKKKAELSTDVFVRTIFDNMIQLND